MVVRAGNKASKGRSHISLIARITVNNKLNNKQRMLGEKYKQAIQKIISTIRKQEDKASLTIFLSAKITVLQVNIMPK